MAYEDFITYTEADPGTDITVTADKVSWVNFKSRNTDSWLVKDFGVNHFAGNFSHLGQVKLESPDSSSYTSVMALANSIDDFQDIRNTPATILIVRLSRGANYEINIKEAYDGDIYGDTYICSNNTLYHLDHKRVEGSPSIIQLLIYEDDGGSPGNLLDTLSLELHEDANLRYFYAVQSMTDDGGSNEDAMGFIQYVDLQEAVAGFAHSIGVIMG